MMIQSLSSSSSLAWTPSSWNQLAITGFSLYSIISIVSVLFTVVLICKSDFFSTTALRSLRYGGPIPEHVAFIMDGNRRWAKKGGLQPYHGHSEGGEKLLQSLQWCLEAGIKVVTVYAFSIENFKRPKSEVDAIMQLAESKFHTLSDRTDVIHKHQVKVRVLGDLSLVPAPLRTIMSQVMLETAHYTSGPTLNICFAYTARHDVATAISDVVNLCRDKRLQPSQVSEQMIAACLSTGSAKGADCFSAFPQLLVRTSGETRLSDFLLWESSDSILSFYDVLWPELTSWDFVKILLEYQAQHRKKQIIHMNKNLNNANADCTFDTQSTSCMPQSELLDTLKPIKDLYLSSLVGYNQAE